MRMTIKMKLAAAFGAVLLMLGGVVWLSISGLSEANSRTDMLINETGNRVRTSLKLQESEAQYGRSVAMALASAETETIKSYIGVAEQMREEQDVLTDELRKVIGEESASDLEQFEKNDEQVSAALAEVFKLAETNSTVHATDLSITQGRASYLEVMDAVDAPLLLRCVIRRQKKRNCKVRHMSCAFI